MIDCKISNESIGTYHHHLKETKGKEIISPRHYHFMNGIYAYNLHITPRQKEEEEKILLLHIQQRCSGFIK